jgi:serine/threonine-protein kinase
MPVPPSQVDAGVTPQIDAVVLQALAKRTDDRYQSAVEFRADVERAVAGTPVTAAVPMVTLDQTQMLTPTQAAAPQGGYEPMYDMRRRPRRRGVAFWFLSFVGVVAAVIAALLIGRFIFGGPAVNQVQVPNLEGLTIEQATTTLEEFQLRLGAQTPEVSDRPVDTVIAQQPAAGESIEQGQSVNVTVSAGLEQVTVPQLIALTSIEAARIALEDANLQLGAIKERNSPQPAGYVLAQEPEEGTQVNAGSSIDITVSSGLVQVPNVTEVSEAQARSDLAQAGFDVQVVEIEDLSVPEGTVLAQSPQAGELLALGSIVTITVSTSPLPTVEPTPLPTVEPTPLPTEEPVAPVEPTPEAPPTDVFAPTP